ncbi:MAG: glycosyltransferase family 4 protein [Flavobacteriaceae bacterium]|jgi:glycosyltransferase involved in cell wall biosynthesis|nr:glycosyltransferase family 4 protein [Flavobacteriaceae bacterium]
MEVIYFTNVFSHYRYGIWRMFLGNKKINFKIYYSNKEINGIQQTSLNKLQPSQLNKLGHIKNISLFGKVIWQVGVITKVIRSRSKVFIFLGEMNIFSTWISAIIARIRRKDVIFWGHGLYGNENFIKSFFRMTFLRLAGHHFLYGEHAKNLMIRKGINKNRIHVIYNSLDHDKLTDIYRDSHNKKFNLFNVLKSSNYVIFSGRLTKTKNLSLLFDAMNHFYKNKVEINLIVVGEGPEKNNLMKKYNNLITSKIVYFAGEIYNEKKLCDYIRNAKLFVSPGNIGLASIHSLTYGTPVCTHNDINYQMPEAEILNKKNSVLFTRNDLESLIDAIERGILLKNKEGFTDKCIKSVSEKYTPKGQNKIITSYLVSLK